MEDRKQVKTIQSVNRAVDILEALNQNRAPMALSELSKKLELNKTTTYHLLKTLELRNLVVNDAETNKYRLGLKIFHWGQAIFEYSSSLVEISLPYMRKIRDKYDETLHLGILEERDSDVRAVYIEKMETSRMVRIQSRIGWAVPLHCTALGKLFLAHFSEEELDKFFEETELIPYTPTTFTTRESLLPELKSSMARGWFYDKVEYQEGVNCVAVPLYGKANRVIGGISISVPTERMTDDYKDDIVKDMLELSRDLSAQLSGLD